MARVDLPCPVLTLVSDPTQSLVLLLAQSVNVTPQTPGEDRMYGAGRYRGVTSGATQRQYAVTADAVTPAEVALLRAWDGQRLCFRDDSGEKCFGWFRSPTVARHAFDSDAAVSFTFTELTYSASTGGFGAAATRPA